MIVLNQCNEKEVKNLNKILDNSKENIMKTVPSTTRITEDGKLIVSIIVDLNQHLPSILSAGSQHTEEAALVGSAAMPKPTPANLAPTNQSNPTPAANGDSIQAIVFDCKKITLPDGKIQIRWEYEYDDNGTPKRVCQFSDLDGENYRYLEGMLKEFGYDLIPDFDDPLVKQSFLGKSVQIQIKQIPNGKTLARLVAVNQ